MSEQRSGEAFYRENGRKADAAIHDEILAGVDPQVELEHRMETFHRLVAKGEDPALIAEMLGLPGAFDVGPGPESLR